jgi:hypothetical protein
VTDITQNATSFLREYAQQKQAHSAKSRRAALTIGAGIAIAGLVGGFAFVGSAGTGGASQQTSISVAELMQGIDLRSLPVQQIAEIN